MGTLCFLLLNGTTYQFCALQYNTAIFGDRTILIATFCDLQYVIAFFANLSGSLLIWISAC